MQSGCISKLLVSVVALEARIAALMTLSLLLTKQRGRGSTSLASSKCPVEHAALEWRNAPDNAQRKCAPKKSMSFVAAHVKVQDWLGRLVLKVPLWGISSRFMAKRATNKRNLAIIFLTGVTHIHLGDLQIFWWQFLEFHFRYHIRQYHDHFSPGFFWHDWEAKFGEQNFRAFFCSPFAWFRFLFSLLIKNTRANMARRNAVVYNDKFSLE